MTYKVQINDLVRDATPDECASIDQAQAEAQAVAQAAADAAAAKETAKEKLKTLGLNYDEIAALVG